ncbi:MAG TPA: WD40 repeat domain-containing protein [Candidatus Tyrphobacter sp.]|nr:WD40 repeat domain-containing protein [Candidatus Tyrphobacter sp.]
MNQLARKILFWVFSAAFGFVSLALILYANGYRIDFKNLSVEKTGGIYIISQPRNAEITLDNLAVSNNSNLISPGTLIGNLTKGRYLVSVSKPGYQSWQKNILVEPSLVAVYDQVVLVPSLNDPKTGAEEIYPASPTSTRSTSLPIEDFDLVEGNQFLIQRNGNLIYSGTFLRGNRLIASSPSGFLITGGPSGEYYLIDLTLNYKTVSIGPLLTRLKETELSLPGPAKILTLSFSPLGDENLLIQTTGALYELDVIRGDLKIIDRGVLAYASSANKIYYLDKDGLHSYDPIIQSNADVLPLPPAFAGRTGQFEFQVSPSGNYFALLGPNHDLYLGAEDGQSFQKISSRVNDFSFSYDSKFLAAITENGLAEIYDLNLDKLFSLNPHLENPTQITWYKDSAHLFVMSGGNLYLMEIDSKNPPLNVTKIADGVKAFRYDSADDFLYFTPGSEIWRLII